MDDMDDIHLLRVGVSHSCHHDAMDDMSDMSFALGARASHLIIASDGSGGPGLPRGECHLHDGVGAVHPGASLRRCARTPVDRRYQNIRG